LCFFFMLLICSASHKGMWEGRAFTATWKKKIVWYR
jgi:hypothetical protein